MKQNIKLLPFILPLRFGWFWIGIWLPFYLEITNYKGIGLLESTIFLFGFIIEVPTGVLSDTFGKKNILAAGFLSYAIGNFLMGISGSFFMLMISVLILVTSAALFSGSDDALLFDTLRQLKRENEFEKHLSKIKIYSLILMSACGFIGVVAYQIWNGLPFILTGILGLIGFGLMFKIEEPIYDTLKYNILDSFKQNFGGFGELLKLKNVWFRFSLVLIASAAAKIFIEVQDPAILLDKGISDGGLGILYSIIPAVTAFGTFIYLKLINRRQLSNKLLFIISTSIFLGIAVSPFIGLGLSIVFLLYRNLFYDVFDIISSNTINQNISSDKRATTLSTYAMIQSLPYVSLGIILGSFIDSFGASIVASGVALVTLASIFVITSAKFGLAEKAKALKK